MEDAAIIELYWRGTRARYARRTPSTAASAIRSHTIYYPTVRTPERA